ncbi:MULTISPECIES: hypothetical protein [Vibrio]|uniref:Uncharacterized protein n=1 Tax=Vibrio cholerae TaxID=666 RepID=A0A7Z7YB10_VIBCL|nr:MULTISPECIES: hypothetical protein [Vibrio]PNV70171.1 hypothetical protein C1Y48_14185 [Vibrio cholerae]TBM42063.1 hypothetical protein EYB64_10605 [Vibrio cholerae]UHJ60304.1 hypothetical protein LUM42_00210 [Vibrio furnissii]GHX16225.1 hypothetical protein VCSRO200_3233 [Vibrio cholerae]GHZ22683.1 hypothetical protein VCSRO123_2657 [Vibrio cholerae]
MPCLRCNEIKTIQAHLIPQVFCKEVQVGKGHATGVKEDGSFYFSQSGTFDKGILCADCDGLLGQLEEYAAKILKSIREHSKGLSFGPKIVEGVDKEKIVRFCAGVLWKYSITQEQYGKINLYGFQDDVKRIAYSEMDIPEWFDVAIFRLRIHAQDDGVFAYRAPLIDRKNRVRLYRFMVGGCLFFVKVHRKKMRDDVLTELWLGREDSFRFCIAPAQQFEEFKISKDLAFNSEKLSSFLDRQDEIAKSKT